MISDNAEFRQDTDRSNDSQSESEHRGCGENVCQEEPALHVQQTGEYAVLVGHWGKADVSIDNLTQELGDDLLANKNTETLKDNFRSRWWGVLAPRSAHARPFLVAELQSIPVKVGVDGAISGDSKHLVNSGHLIADTQTNIDMPCHEITNFWLPGGLLSEQDNTLVEEETQAIDSEQILGQRDSIRKL